MRFHMCYVLDVLIEGLITDVAAGIAGFSKEAKFNMLQIVELLANDWVLTIHELTPTDVHCWTRSFAAAAAAAAVVLPQAPNHHSSLTVAVAEIVHYYTASHQPRPSVLSGWTGDGQRIQASESLYIHSLREY